MNNLNEFTTKENGQALSVSEFNALINKLVSVVPVLVEGEVSNYRDIPGRNFCYFDIKDKSSVAKCFQGFWQSSKISLENGTLIKVFGYPTLQRNGSLVIDVREIIIVGEGELMRKYLEMKEKLKKEGLFDERHKKELPQFPRKIGLIAGKNSSAYHDVTAEIKERWQGADIIFHPSKVQGIYAKSEIMRAIQYFNKKKPVGALIIARGGGSLEDLQAFDSEEIVREIFASRIPIVSAIGHEDHWTLSDFVADVRAKTPTKAAQLAVPKKQDVSERLDYYTRQMGMITKHKIDDAQSELSYFARTSKMKQQSKINEIKANIDKILETGRRSIRSVIEMSFNEINIFERSLKLVHPQNILKRGFAIVEKKQKRVTSIENISCNDLVITTLQDGYFEGTINRKFK
ncbi:MAG: exodeoxyribonuclease VII large subunit [Patescibacteria group bacterium]|nr:exodeoxyribonuclease VII large subunit [Patescibacteria group bacterium]